MTGERKSLAATVAKSERLQGMLEDPKFRDAWDGFTDALGKAAALIEHGVQPTGHEVGKAAQLVLDAGAELPEEGCKPYW